ncbi:hypothetical protein FJT64_007870 [Amphibalanus amphitrite]|uniref:Uncharacterized protein n=1 Tax=Amphibalanus amphitrite TaxID=1232801 RepID=A0A6A4VSQ2_AMPAM|nr:hypothetical protein FJT64_007870 [Amphibalanus amphitrite]
MSDTKPRGCGCFNPRQASLVVSLTLVLLYGLAALALLVDLSSAVLHEAGGRALQVGEAVALGALLASLAGAALLGRAVTTGSPRLLLGWLAWHGTCWVLAALTAIAVAVTGALRATASPLILGIGSAVHALALVLLAYCGLVVLRYYRLLAESQLLAAAADQKEKDMEKKEKEMEKEKKEMEKKEKELEKERKEKLPPV